MPKQLSDANNDFGFTEGTFNRHRLSFIFW